METVAHHDDETGAHQFSRTRQVLCRVGKQIDVAHIDEREAVSGREQLVATEGLFHGWIVPNHHQAAHQRAQACRAHHEPEGILKVVAGEQTIVMVIS